MPNIHFSNCNLFLCKVYLFERERETETERENEPQTGSFLSVESPVEGSISWTVRSSPESKSRVRCLTNWATQVPLQLIVNILVPMLFLYSSIRFIHSFIFFYLILIIHFSFLVLISFFSSIFLIVLSLIFIKNVLFCP